MNNQIHWWELPDECPVKIEENYLKKIIKSTSNQSIKRKTLQNIKSGKKCPRIKTIKKLITCFKISPNEMESKITHIKTHNKLVRINFPIKESPEHIQILAHAIFDGSKKKNACIRYKVRYGIPTKEMFKNLLIKSFGYDCYGHTDNCYFLYKSLSELLANHYKINEYHSKKAIFSDKVINLCKNNKFRRVILRAAFVDEGYCKCNTTSKNHEKFRLTLVSSIKNLKLAKQLLYLTHLENYETSLYSARGDSEFTIAILTKSKKNFYKDIIRGLPLNNRKRIEAEKVITKDF